MALVFLTSVVQCVWAVGLTLRTTLLVLIVLTVCIIGAVDVVNLAVMMMLLGTGTLVLCVVVPLRTVCVALTRLILISDPLIVKLCVVTKAPVTLLLMTRWLMCLTRPLSSLSPAEIPEFVMTVSSGCVGVRSVWLSVLSLVVSSGFVYVSPVRWIMLRAEVRVWRVALKVLTMKMLYSVVHLVVSAGLLPFLLMPTW